MQQKNIPSTRHTATLTQFHFNSHRRLPTVIYTKPKLKERERERHFPFRVVPLGPLPSSCLAPARAVGPLVGPLIRTGWWQKGARSVPSAQYRDHGLIALAPVRPSSSWTATGTRMRRLGAPKPTREPQTSARPKAAGQASPRKEREEIHMRAPELQVKKKRTGGEKRAPAEPRPHGDVERGSFPRTKTTRRC